MDREWWHPLPDYELSDNYTSSTDKWLLDNLGDAGEKLDRLWKERCELEQQNQKLREAIEDTLLFMEDAEQNYGYDLSHEIYTLEKALDEVSDNE